jgi:hypothetical protein
LTEGDFTQVKYWFDLAIKAIIGVVVSLIGLDYRAVKTDLVELETARYHMTTEVEILKNELNHIKRSLDKIDDKLGKAINR